MGFDKHFSLRRAERVLSHLDGLIEHFDMLGKEAGQISCYANGREQGFFVSQRVGSYTDWRGVAFGECRGSDQVAVYFGHVKDFDFAGHVPSEESYEKARYFSSEENAARAIGMFLWGKTTEVPTEPELRELDLHEELGEDACDA